jgi:hypothetical protein
MFPFTASLLIPVVARLSYLVSDGRHARTWHPWKRRILSVPNRRDKNYCQSASIGFRADTSLLFLRCFDSVQTLNRLKSLAGLKNLFICRLGKLSVSANDPAVVEMHPERVAVREYAREDFDFTTTVAFHFDSLSKYSAIAMRIRCATLYFFRSASAVNFFMSSGSAQNAIFLSTKEV